MPTRKEESFTVTDTSGVRKTYTVVDYPLSDDIMVAAAKAVGAEFKFGITVEDSVFSRDIKDQLVRTNVTT